MTTGNSSSKPEQGTRAVSAGCCRGPMRRASESARDILDRRLAKGELTKKQYEEIKREIEQLV